jgi:TLC domain
MSLNLENVWPEFIGRNLSTMSFFLKENFTLDFFQPIDRFDSSQLYISGLFLLIACLFFIILMHNFIYYFISNPIATNLFKKIFFTSQSQPKVGKSSIKLRATPRISGTTYHENIWMEEKINKFNIAFWRAFNYGFLFLYGIYFCFFLEEDQWIYEYEKFVVPIRYYSWPIAIYYHLSLAHYLYGLICLLREPKLKDFTQMLVHHFVTLGLEFGSYYFSGYTLNLIKPNYIYGF